MTVSYSMAVGEEVLREAWGDRYDEMLARAHRQTARLFHTPALLHAFAESGMGDDPDMVMALAGTPQPEDLNA